MPKLPQLNLAGLLEKFFSQRLLNERGLSHNTISSYRDTFRLLLKFVRKKTRRQPSQQTLQNWDAPTVLKFLDHVEKERNCQVTTRNTRLAAIRTFMRWVAEEEPSLMALTSRVVCIPQKRFNRRLLGYLTVEELRVLLATPPTSNWSGRRDRLLLAMLYNTGARISELLGIDRGDVQWKQPVSVIIQGKGRKTRSLPLSKSTSSELKAWLANLPPDPATPVFINRFGQRLSRSGVEKRLKMWVKTAGNALHGKSISPHTFRHTTAMHLLQNGVDITSIAQYLGHESVETTHRYIELDMKQKEECLQKLDSSKVTLKRFQATDDLLAFLEKL